MTTSAVVRVSLIALAFITVTQSASALIIYQDDFSGSSTDNLEGLAPDVRPGTEVWTMPNSLALRQWKANGNVEAGGFLNGQNSIQLPFTPQPGNIYKLRTTIQVDGAELFGKWIGFGFSNKLLQVEGEETTEGESAFAFSTIEGAPWAFLADWVSVVHFAGPQNNNILTDSNTAWGLGVGVPTPLRLELDTTADQWTTTLFRESDEFQYAEPYTFPTNPTIEAVGFTKVQGSLGQITNFSLEVVQPVVGLPGDFNDDGTVTLADYTVWRDNLGSNADLLNDNQLGTPVGAAHYDLWKSQFASSANAPLAVSVAIPEPASGWLLCLAGAFLLCHSAVSQVTRISGQQRHIACIEEIAVR